MHIKDKFIDQMVNYIRLAQKLAHMLRTYRTCNPIVGSSKNEFNNKLLSDVLLVKVTLSQFIYIYRERERESFGFKLHLI